MAARPPDDQLEVDEHIDDTFEFCLPADDIRLCGLSLRANANIYQAATKQTVKAADTDRGKGRAKNLLRLRDEERRVLAGQRRRGISYGSRRSHVANSRSLGTVKALYQNLGIAEMLTMGDWSVGRLVEVSEAFGTVPVKDIQCLLLQFFLKNNHLSTKESIDEGRLIHLDLGCGNGLLLETLRNDTTTTPFDNGHLLHEYWAEFGFADKIYYTINDLLLTQVKEEYTEDAGLIQFVNLISRLIMRMVFSAQTSQVESSKKHRALSQLTKDPNRIREILADLEHYLPELAKLVKVSEKGMPIIKGDKEFLLDADMAIGNICIEKIKEFLKDGKLFFSTYFKDGLYYPNTHTVGIGELFAEVERDIHEIQSKMDFLDGKIAQEIENIKNGNGSEEAKNLFISEKAEAERKLDSLKTKRNQFIESPNNLARSITIFPHNVAIGRFEDFAAIYPEEPTFNFVHASRSSSHAEDAEYGNVTFEAAKRLKPGGIILDDGKRESYTRYERIDQLKSLKGKLGSEYKIGIILHPNRKTGMSVLIERALSGKDGKPVFFSDQYMDKLLSSECTYMLLDDFDTNFPIIAIKNGVIDRLRKLLITEKTGDDHWARVFAGRMQFRGLHRHIDSIVETMTRGLSREQLSIQQDSLIAEILEKIRQKVKVINRKERLAQNGRIPAREERSMSLAQTYQLLPHNLDSPGGFHINHTRYFRVADLPTNADVPDFNEMEVQRLALIAKLKELRDKLGAPPIVVVEFDKCFTNPMLQEVLADILHDPQTTDLFEIQHVSLRELERGREPKYPEIQDGRIYILGGSLNDAYDEAGTHFTNNFSRTLLDKIAKNDSARAFGICFGSQSLLQAYGQQIGKDFRTERGNLQFGAFPVEFEHGDVFGGLGGKICTAAFTRSGYSITKGSEAVPDMRPLACEPTQEGIKLPPVAWSLLDGKVVTTQFHPDIRLSSREHQADLQRYLQRAWPTLQNAIPYSVKLNSRRPYQRPHMGQSQGRRPLSPLGIVADNLAMKAEESSGMTTPWVQRDLSMPILIPVLGRFAQSLLMK